MRPCLPGGSARNTVAKPRTRPRPLWPSQRTGLLCLDEVRRRNGHQVIGTASDVYTLIVAGHTHVVSARKSSRLDPRILSAQVSCNQMILDSPPLAVGKPFGFTRQTVLSANRVPELMYRHKILLGSWLASLVGLWRIACEDRVRHKAPHVCLKDVSGETIPDDWNRYLGGLMPRLAKRR